MKFKKEFMQNLVWDDEDGAEIIEDNIVENSRWSILHAIVFKINDKFYTSHYSVGATENQPETPYEYEDNEIECQEVIPVEKTVIKYIPADQG